MISTKWNEEPCCFCGLALKQRFVLQSEEPLVDIFFFFLYQRALLSAVPAVSMEMKESYLDWSYSTGGFKKARKTFKR